MQMLKFAPIGALVLLLGACSETPQATAKKEVEKPPEAVTGQTALFKMYQVARTWAPDIQVLKMNSQILNDVPNVPRGKAAAWEATFTSAEKSKMRSYTYSIVEALPTLHKGVFAGLEEDWSGGAKGTNTPFIMAAVKVDSDAAYATALKEAGDYDKKNPGKPVIILLEKVAKYPNPVWRIVWGESVGTSNFSIYVDAMTGEFKERLH